MQAGFEEGAGVWPVLACLGIWLEVGPLTELETEVWRQVFGLPLLREGTDVARVGEGVGVKVWVGVTGVMVCVGVWDVIEEREWVL